MLKPRFWEKVLAVVLLVVAMSAIPVVYHEATPKGGTCDPTSPMPNPC